MDFTEEFTFQGKFPVGDRAAKNLKEIQVKLMLDKGRPPTKKNYYFRALPELALPPPCPQFGQLGPLFSDVKNNVLRVLREKKYQR